MRRRRALPCRVRRERLLAKHGADDSPPPRMACLEDAAGVLLGQGEQDTGGLPDLGQGHVDAVELALVLQAELTHQLELGVQPLLLIRTPGPLRNLVVCGQETKGEKAGGEGVRRCGAGIDECAQMRPTKGRQEAAGSNIEEKSILPVQSQGEIAGIACEGG